MLRAGGRHRSALLVVALALLTLFSTVGFAGVTQGTGPLNTPAPALTIYGSWAISTALSYANTSILVEGSVTILSGGSLTLQNVQLSLTEPLALQFGIEVRAGGALTASGSTFESATSTNALWMKADSGATLSLTGGSVLDLGGAAGPMGFVVEAAHASFRGVTFNNYYEGLIVSAADVTVDGCTFATTTSGSSSTWVVSTSGTSSGFVMTHSKIVTPSMMGGALDVAASSDIENNTFTLNPHATNPTPVLIGYSGAGGSVNASGTTFAYNVVSGSDVTDYDSSNVVISHNQVLNDGGAEYVHDYGIHAAVVYGSGKGIWINGLQIEHNYVSESTGYGIRVEQNVTNAVIAYNTITNVSTSPTAGTSNGVATYIGIYLIRGVTHTLVYANLIDNSADQGSASISTAGIGLESEIANTTLADNTILNTDIGIWVQGDWNDGPGNIGPSWDNTIMGNTIENTKPIIQTRILAAAIENYDWANRTTIANNLIEGWNLVPSGAAGYEGVAIIQASDYGTIEGNVVASAGWGIVLGYFYGQMANASYNAVYGNTFAVTNSILIDDTYTTPLPIVNVVNLLTSQSGSNGLPSSSQTSIGRVYGEAFSESGGRFTGTLETSSPITGSIQNFSSSLPWNTPGFSVRVAGDLGTAAGSLAVTQVNATQVRYTVPSSNGLEHTVSLYVPSANYSAWYTIQTRLGSAATQEFRLNSSVGPATFETNGTGTLTVTVILDNWTAIQTNNSVTLELNAYLEDGFPVSGEMAQIDFAASYPIHSVILGPTDNSGGAVYYSLPPGPSVTGVTLIGGSYSLHSYSVTNPQSRVVQVSVVLVPGPPGSGNQSGTGSTVVRFTEHGLSPGTTWWVSVTGPVSENLSSSESTISFTLVNGTYLYTFGISSEPSAAEPQYMLVVPYTSTNLTVDFTGEAGATSASRLPLLSLGEAVGLGVAAIGLAGALVTGTRRRVWRVPIRGAAQWLIRLRRR